MATEAEVKEAIDSGEAVFVEPENEEVPVPEPFEDDTDADIAKVRKLGLLYRDDEPVLTGKKWVDGKEIWRVVYTDFGTFPNTTATTKYLTSVLSADVDTVTFFQHVYKNSNDYYYQNSMHVYGSGSLIVGVYLNATYMGFIVNTDYDASGFTSEHIIVEYTKA